MRRLKHKMTLILALAVILTLGALVGTRPFRGHEAGRVWTPPLAQAQQEEPVWTWSIEKLQHHVNKVRAGKDMTPKSWPNGARVAVGLSFDLDNETGPLRDGSESPALLAQGEYGSRA